jgi:hypothetical protein
MMSIRFLADDESVSGAKRCAMARLHAGSDRPQLTAVSNAGYDICTAQISTDNHMAVRNCKTADTMLSVRLFYNGAPDRSIEG